MDNSYPETGKPDRDYPQPEKPDTDEPDSEKHAQLSINSHQEKSIKTTHELNTHQSIGADAPDAKDVINVYREILKENIEYDILCRDHKYKAKDRHKMWRFYIIIS